MKVDINFASIRTIVDFYKQLSNRLELPAHFGNNLDALSDVISGDLKMPLTLSFLNVTEEQKITFGPLINTLEELTKEVSGFTFLLNVTHTVFDASLLNN